MEPITEMLQASAIDGGEDLPASEQGTFHPFPRLPFELRTKIWIETIIPLPSPRLIEVSVEVQSAVSCDPDAIDGHDEQSPMTPQTMRFVDRDPLKDWNVPSIFYTCKESRDVVATFYDFVFLSTSVDSTFVPNDSPYHAPKQSGIFFQPEHDIIYFHQDLFDEGMKPALKMAKSQGFKLRNIRSVAVQMPFPRKERRPSNWPYPRMENLTGLKAVIIVLPPSPFAQKGIREILNGQRSGLGEMFMAKLREMTAKMEEDLRAMLGLQNVPVIRIMDRDTLDRWIYDPQFRKNGLPWEVTGDLAVPLVETDG